MSTFEITTRELEGDLVNLTEIGTGYHVGSDMTFVIHLARSPRDRAPAFVLSFSLSTEDPVIEQISLDDLLRPWVGAVMHDRGVQGPTVMLDLTDLVNPRKEKPDDSPDPHR